MDAYDAVVSALRTLIAKSGHQLGAVVVLTEKDLPATAALIERLNIDSAGPLAKRLRNEVVGAGVKFHTVMIKFPGVSAYEISLR